MPRPVFLTLGVRRTRKNLCAAQEWRQDRTHARDKRTIEKNHEEVEKNEGIRWLRENKEEDHKVF